MQAKHSGPRRGAKEPRDAAESCKSQPRKGLHDAMEAVAEELLAVESLDGDEFKTVVDRFVPRAH